MQLASRDSEERLRQLLNDKQSLENQCVSACFVSRLVNDIY